MSFQNFRPDTTLYHPENALALGQAAQLAYADAAAISTRCAAWGLPDSRYIESTGSSGLDTQLFVAASDALVVIAFRGTEPKKLRDWLTDANAVQVAGPFGGRVHAGFSLALGSVWGDLLDCLRALQNKAQSLWFTGHSLGAALATLAVARLRDELDKPVHGLYTFGQPRTGDRVFERAYNLDSGSRSFRFVNNNDLVTRVPTRLMGYSHVGKFLYFDDQGDLQTDSHFWYQFLNRVEGRIDDLGKPGTDGVKDHAMAAYLAHLEKNRALNPF